MTRAAVRSRAWSVGGRRRARRPAPSARRLDGPARADRDHLALASTTGVGRGEPADRQRGTSRLGPPPHGTPRPLGPRRDDAHRPGSQRARRPRRDGRGCRSLGRVDDPMGGGRPDRPRDRRHGARLAGGWLVRATADEDHGQDGQWHPPAWSAIVVRGTDQARATGRVRGGPGSACGPSRGRWMGATGCAHCAVATSARSAAPTAALVAAVGCLGSRPAVVRQRGGPGQRRLGSRQGGTRRLGPPGSRRSG